MTRTLIIGGTGMLEPAITHCLQRGDAVALVARDKKKLDALDYREIILGFKIERGRSRWLTNAEISTGAIDAVMAGRKKTVIGVTEPWDARP